jgi:hypothetical protein
MIPLPVIASAAGGRSFDMRLHRMKRFFLSMKYRSKRHRVIYDVSGLVSLEEARQALTFAVKFVKVSVL